MFFIRNECSIFMNVKRVNLMFKPSLLDLEKTKCPLLSFSTTLQHPVRIPISVSLLNHSNLFLWMPKIYIFHKLLQGILKCYGLIVVPNIFGQLKLTSPLWRLSLSHTITPITQTCLTVAKLTAENVKDLLFCLATHREKKKDISIYFTLVIFPQCLSFVFFPSSSHLQVVLMVSSTYRISMKYTLERALAVVAQSK